jgi:hypothetical protein
VPEHRVFKAFFSYAHHDAKTDPALLQAFSAALEDRVNAKILNARFVIWRDKDDLRTGDRWDAKIEAELRAADVMIVLLTPRWVESEHCRKEYAIFEEIEATRKVGDYVVPILVRTIKRQERYFTQDQRNVYERVLFRQYQAAIATDFLKLSEADRTAIVDKIADDIEGMIERRRDLVVAEENPINYRTRKARSRKEFTRKAHDFEEFDIISSAEALIDCRHGDEPRNIYAQVDFTERLYIIHDDARIEFGVQFAYWSFRNGGPGRLRQGDDLRSASGRQNAYYVSRFSEPDTIVICIQPAVNKENVAELALPPSINENRFAKVATATSSVDVAKLTSQLDVMIKSDGLWVAGDGDRKLSQTTSQWIEAIMTVAAKRDPRVRESGRLTRNVPIEER